jgi:hypothetical protein
VKLKRIICSQPDAPISLYRVLALEWLEYVGGRLSADSSVRIGRAPRVLSDCRVTVFC